jgi:hypothetical protein
MFTIRNVKTRLRGTTKINFAPTPVFSPLSLFASGEQGAWYDPSDLSTMFTDTAGTTPATDGSAVARINDKSGRGNHATQGIFSRRPILRQLAGGEYYLEFDGIDDSLVTGTITPGTDKVQVFAGVRRFAVGSNMIVEHSSNVNTNNGSFFLNYSGSLDRYSSTARANAGTSITQTAVFDVDLPTPESSVLSATHDIATNLSTIRRNAVAGTDATGDKGTGNYLAYPMFIGARGGTSLFFNGHIYSLIVRFGANLDTPTIENVESYVANKTGVTL